jgi:hypothetical protein
MKRRDFIDHAGKLVAMSAIGVTNAANGFNKTSPMKSQLSTIRIRNVNSNFEREPMHPYRFKGSVITEGWQVAAYLESESGIHKVGIGGQGTLVRFHCIRSASVAGGNALMYAMSNRHSRP